jgi:hypothetical protein
MTRSKGTAEIVYQADDDEAYAFACGIEQALLSAGWTVSRLVKQSASAEPNGLNRPFLLREGGLVVRDWSSVIVLTQGPLAEKPFEADTPLDAIMGAFEAAQIPGVQTIPHESSALTGWNYPYRDRIAFVAIRPKPLRTSALTSRIF